MDFVDLLKPTPTIVRDSSSKPNTQPHNQKEPTPQVLHQAATQTTFESDIVEDILPLSMKMNQLSLVTSYSADSDSESSTEDSSSSNTPQKPREPKTPVTPSPQASLQPKTPNTPYMTDITYNDRGHVDTESYGYRKPDGVKKFVTIKYEQSPNSGEVKPTQETTKYYGGGVPRKLFGNQENT
jgi:hypothetical protein